MWLRAGHVFQRLTVGLSLAERFQPAHLILLTEQWAGSIVDLCGGAWCGVGGGTDASSCAGGNECRARENEDADREDSEAPAGHCSHASHLLSVAGCQRATACEERTHAPIKIRGVISRRVALRLRFRRVAPSFMSKGGCARIVDQEVSAERGPTSDEMDLLGPVGAESMDQAGAGEMGARHEPHEWSQTRRGQGAGEVQTRHVGFKVAIQHWSTAKQPEVGV